MKGEISSAKPSKRHPLDWYVEQGWEWEQIAAAIGLEEQDDGAAIWDPACGYGHSLSRPQGAGFSGKLLASDLVNNLALGDFENPGAVEFAPFDFLERTIPAALACSIWSNPPFSYKKVGGEIISQAFARQALRLATHRVVFLLPLKWLAGQARGRFLREHPPQMILIFTQRPSMPPGDRIQLMGSRAYAGGMVDYCAVVWNQRVATLPDETKTVWLPRLGEQG